MIYLLIQKKMILHPTKANQDDFRGLIHIISRMKWYCSLSKMLNEDGQDDTVPAELKPGIISLYTAILSYLMTIMCSHPGRLDIKTPSDVFYLRYQQVDLKTVTDAENVLPDLNENRIQRPLEGLLKAVSMKPAEPASDVEHPGPSGEHAQLLNDFGILDPRLSIETFGIKSSHQTYQLHTALFSTKEWKTFQNWNATTEQGDSLLWVRGETGQGKTMLLTATVRALVSATAQGRSDRPFLSFFFFDHAKPDTNKAAAAIKTIIWLILVYQPDLSMHLAEKVSSTGHRHFNDPNDFLALSAVFYNIIEDERFVETYIVVDALDECMAGNGRPGVDEFLILITESLKLSKKIRWLVSSDSSARLESALSKNGYLNVNLNQDLLLPGNAIYDFITAKVADLARTKKYDRRLEEEVTEELYRASRGNYLWVNIVCEALRYEDMWYTTDLLHDVKDTSVIDNSLYDNMFNNFNRLPRRDNEFCTKVFCPQWPLSTMLSTSTNWIFSYIWRKEWI